jgi:hypothetical protein
MFGSPNETEEDRLTCGEHRPCFPHALQGKHTANGHQLNSDTTHKLSLCLPVSQSCFLKKHHPQQREHSNLSQGNPKQFEERKRDPQYRR